MNSSCVSTPILLSNSQAVIVRSCHINSPITYKSHSFKPRSYPDTFKCTAVLQSEAEAIEIISLVCHISLQRPDTQTQYFYCKKILWKSWVQESNGAPVLT